MHTSIQIFLFWASGRAGVCSTWARHGLGGVRPRPKTLKKPENVRKRQKKLENLSPLANSGLGPGSGPKWAIFELKKLIFGFFGARARHSRFSSSGGPFSAFSGLGPEIHYFRAPEAHFLHFQGSGPKLLFSSSWGPFSAFSGLGPEIRYFRAPEDHFQPFRGFGPKFARFELLRPIFGLFGARARNSLFSSSRGPFSTFSGFWPEIRYFRAPEVHFLHFQGSSLKFLAIFELLRPISNLFGALTRNSLFSSSWGPFSAFSGLGPEIRYFRAPEVCFRLFRGFGPKFVIFELLRPIFGLFGVLTRNSLFSSSWGPCSAFSGLGLEIHYFRAPEDHFQPFRGSDPKFIIFEFLRHIFCIFRARARNSLFSSSWGSFSRFSGLWPEIRYFRAPEAHFQPFRGSGPKFARFELLWPICCLFGVRARKFTMPQLQACIRRCVQISWSNMQLSVLTCFVLHCFVSLYPVHLMHGFALVYLSISLYIYIYIIYIYIYVYIKIYVYHVHACLSICVGVPTSTGFGIGDHKIKLPTMICNHILVLGVIFKIDDLMYMLYIYIYYILYYIILYYIILYYIILYIYIYTYMYTCIHIVHIYLSLSIHIYIYMAVYVAARPAANLVLHQSS